MDKRCCFAGHGTYNYGEDISQNLISVAEKLITEEDVTEFMVGNYGSFDRICAHILKKLKQKYPHIKVCLTIPYLTKSAEDKADEFDEVVIFEIPESTPRKLKIIKTNEYMVNESDFVVCYIAHTWGGAYKTFQHAKRKNKTIINLNELNCQ